MWLKGNLYLKSVCAKHDYILYNFCGRKVSRLRGKLLFCHKTFMVTRDEPKDCACDGDY